ncbi:MAG: peptidoglycan editing factor PgeF [Legionellales bacterium]|nr:peptidoglycan editing factor PgeF [Legionellales bacterium]
MKLHCIIPEWPAPKWVKAFATTRRDGFSEGAFAGLNLGDHVNDNPIHVQQNRELLIKEGYLPHPPNWLQQIHSNIVIDAEKNPTTLPAADACYTQHPQRVCIVLTADCLPLLITDIHGREVAAVHAGWKGLHSGIINNACNKFQAPPRELLVWIGPGISGAVYEVNNEFRERFLMLHPDYHAAFTPSQTPDHWLANLPWIARYQCEKLGIPQCYGGDICTYQNPDHYFSYRRNNMTGRQASLIWLERPS